MVGMLRNCEGEVVKNTATDNAFKRLEAKVEALELEIKELRLKRESDDVE